MTYITLKVNVEKRNTSLRFTFISLLQALKTEMVQYLLKLLEAGLEALDNPASTKAQIVKALKAMQRSLQYGEQVLYELCHEKNLLFPYVKTECPLISAFVFATKIIQSLYFLNPKISSLLPFSVSVQHLKWTDILSAHLKPNSAVLCP